MFGISWTEFLVIILVGVLVIPARHWPDVARFLGRVVKFIRNLIWKITDATENMRDQIDREIPIDKIVKQTTGNMMDVFSQPLPRRASRATPSQAKGKKK